MSLLQEIVFVANNSKALKDIKQIETEVKRIQSLGESAIKIDIDKNGIARVFSQLKSDTGAVVNLVRQLNAETGQLEEKSSSVSINYDKIEKNNAKIEAEAKRLLAQEDELARKTAERARKEQEIAEARERQSAHNQRQRGLELTFANYDDYIKSLNLTEEQLEKMGLASDTAKEKTAQLGNQAQKTGGQFTLLNTIFIRLAHALLSSVVRSFREAITEMKNVDTQLTTISRITQTNISDLDALKNKAYEVGNQYGVLASDYLSAAAAFTRAGYREQAEDLAELSSKMQIAGQVSAETANQLLIATDKAYGFNGSVTELSAVMDKMTVIDHNYATSVEKIAEGIGLVAPIASQAHMSMDELIAAMGTITAVTQRSGSESARALRALILSIIKDTTTEIEEGVTWTVEEINTLQDALKTYAPTVVAAAEATGTLIDPMEAIAALSKAYEEGLLTEAKLADITSKLGGKLRASQLLSLIQNYSGMYTQMMSDMGNAIGAVDKDVDKALQSWEVKLNQLKNTFTKFVQDSLDTNLIKGLIDSVNFLVSGFGNLGTVLGIVAGAFIALNITRIVGWFTNLGKSVSDLGGGFKNLILVLTNYKTASQAGAVGTEAFNTALEGTSIAASMAQIAITALVAAISIAIIAINKHKQALDEAIAKGKTSYQDLKTIDEFEGKYRNLLDAYKEGKITEEEYAEGKDEVIQKLKDEGVWVDDVTGKYSTLEEKIDAATEKAKEYKRIETKDALDAAEQKLHEARHPWYEIFDIHNTVAEAVEGILRNANRDEFIGMYNSGASEADTLVRYYELAIERREELDRLGQRGSDEDKWLQKYIEALDEAVTEYKELKGIIEEPVSSTSEDTVIRKTDETAKSIKGLADELTSATKALDEYNKKLKEGGEKGDSFKSYADAYKKAVEMYEKGLTGSNQYMSAIELIFGKVEDYEAAGKLLGNAFVKSMFEGGGDDYGANAANYIRTHINEFEGVQITQGDNGTFGLMVTDMEKFAESTGLSADALWTLIDALDIFDSKTTYTRDQLFDFMGLEDDGREKFVNLTALINDLAGQGKSAREIKGIVEAIKELAETDGNITISEPENLDQTIDDVVELNKEAEKDKDIEVVITSNSEEFFDGIKKEINQINGSTIYIGLKYKSSLYDLHGVRGRYTYASGTKSARGGLSLVNEEGAEIIYANGKAWIAGGGDPTITNLPAGAGVFNARETREILARSGIESHDGKGAYVGGIPDSTTASSVVSNIVSGRGGKSKLTKDLLDKIADYINDILKKAKEALQKQLDAIDAQIEKLKREHDAEEDANKLEELRLKILEAEKRLAEAENERTVRYFNKETGQWEWMADQKAVAEAQKALQDARDAYDKEVAEQAYKAQIQALEDQKDALNKAYDELEDNWQKILEELEKNVNGNKTVNIEALLKKLLGTKGGSYVPDIKAILEAIAAFTANPTSVLDEATTAQIMSAQSSTNGGASSVLSALFGSSSYDLNSHGQSVFGGSSTIVGDTIYYINGVHIGSDMVDKPLSQILSVLPIYAN